MLPVVPRYLSCSSLFYFSSTLLHVLQLIHLLPFTLYLIHSSIYPASLPLPALCKVQIWKNFSSFLYTVITPFVLQPLTLIAYREKVVHLSSVNLCLSKTYMQTDNQPVSPGLSSKVSLRRAVRIILRSEPKNRNKGGKVKTTENSSADKSVIDRNFNHDFDKY